VKTVEKTRESNKLKYSIVYEDLVNAIRNGDYKCFESIPSEEELCLRYSVSRPTVSTAINMLVEDNIVRRVRGKGTFVTAEKTSASEQPPRESEQSSIGVLVPGGASFNHTQVIVDSILMQSELRKFKPLVSRPYSLENMGKILLHLSNDVNCFLVYPHFDLPSFAGFIKKLQDKKSIVVLMNFILSNIDTDYVIPDYEKAAYLAAEHLIKKGRKKIAYLTQPRLDRIYPSVNAVDEHFKGYQKALLDYGYTPDRTIVTEEKIRSNSPPGFFSNNVYVSYLAALELFTDRKDISGLVTFNDMNAIGALIALEERGINVPDDTSVVGFGDDSELHTYYSLNRQGRCTLTTVSAHREIIALEATEIACAKMAGSHADTLHQKRIEPTLVVRET